MPATNIKTEIDRIVESRDLSFDAVAAKGGTVPSGATIDDLPAAIMSIPSGSEGNTFQMSATLSSAGWYRMLYYGSDMLATILEFKLFIKESQGAGTESGEIHRIKYPTTYGGTAAFSDEYSSGETLLIDKIRRTYGGSKDGVPAWGFDIHYTGGSTKTVYAELVISGPYDSESVFIEDLTSVADAPSGESVWPERDFSQRTEGDITSLCSFSKSSGSSTLTLDSVYRFGHMVSIEVHVKPTATISSGSDIWSGTFNGPLPATGAQTAGYYSQRSLVATIAPSGTTTFRNASASNLSSGNESAYRFNYLTK